MANRNLTYEPVYQVGFNTIPSSPAKANPIAKLKRNLYNWPM